MESAGAPVFETYVPEAFAPNLKTDAPAMVELPGRSPMKGRIEQIVRSADPLTRTCLVKIGFADDARDVMPGIFGTAVFELAQSPEVRVAVSALATRAGLEGVFVVRNGAARFCWLKLGERHGDFATVLAALDGSEVVVDAPKATLNEGSPVRIVHERH